MRITELRERLTNTPLLPVMPVTSVRAAIEDIEQLTAMGVGVIEILLRTTQAKVALEEARKRFPRCLFGAGTVMNASHVCAAVAAGADFLVSPGLTPALRKLVADTELPHVPGVQTASEVMAAVEYGYDLLKYYPSGASNGPVVLADYANIFAGVGFVPTGSIDAGVLSSYGALANVVAVGGSWMLPSKAPIDISEFQRQVSAFKTARQPSSN
jgi:2-dehydro-3-deoxyphosphogluconate aldolase/(4S)-4-hydroxy-2-oxoglutarate aldolase